MKSEAIRCAVKLHSEPTLLARFNDPFRKLPRGITELLRIVSSEAALNNISRKNKLHAPHLKKVLVNYIQLVLLQDNHSNERKLGLNSTSDTSHVKLHYKLLMNIFHPDKSSDYISPKFSQTILNAYKHLQHNPENINITSLKEASQPLKPKYCYSVKNTSPPKAKQKTTIGKITLLKSSAISILMIAFGLILLIPSSPQLISKKSTENSAIKNDGSKLSGWKSSRARNIQRKTSTSTPSKCHYQNQTACSEQSITL